ncbi:hypothetical protein PV325_004010 [Microctonus aethiopoides]|uniref:Uncharacterized protein n=1 Tax=Microctonus aethiopoides TaxID=144406 RepID=A0AA39KQX6_9HYME|nr:hypothetical protein PV325_004010 [Microctonus aethiopoides]KAK0170469.1 hypothetical protein PV328_011029 [Microctonus aethiopoides]
MSFGTVVRLAAENRHTRARKSSQDTSALVNCMKNVVQERDLRMIDLYQGTVLKTVVYNSTKVFSGYIGTRYLFKTRCTRVRNRLQIIVNKKRRIMVRKSFEDLIAPENLLKTVVP